ncbi:MAG: hypothetical protein HY023_11535 [Chloroflexi bacterium]|nr:hypothetical protein [Chloroflexota bacterium]
MSAVRDREMELLAKRLEKAGEKTKGHEQGAAISSVALPKLDPVREGFAPVIEFYHLLKALPFVESVHADRESDGFVVWVVVSHTEETDREQIYEREWEVMDNYEGVGLDVHLIERDGRTDSDLLAGQNFEITLRAPHAETKPSAQVLEDAPTA